MPMEGTLLKVADAGDYAIGRDLSPQTLDFTSPTNAVTLFFENPGLIPDAKLKVLLVDNQVPAGIFESSFQDIEASGMTQQFIWTFESDFTDAGPVLVDLSQIQIWQFILDEGSAATGAMFLWGPFLAITV